MTVGLVANDSGNNDMIKQKEAQSVGSLLFTAYEGAKDAAISIKITKGSTEIAENFVKIPAVLSAIFRYVKVIKICAGIVALGTLYSNIKKLIWKEGFANKGFACYRIYSSAKKITRAVSLVMGYARDFGLLASSALKWTVVTDYIFMPVKFISAGISSYQFGYKIALYSDFVKRTQSENVKHNLQFVSNLENELKRIEVITDECPLKLRCDALLERLKNENEMMHEKAVTDSKVLICQLKDRISAQIVSNAIDLMTRASALAIFLIGFSNPISALPASIVGLSLNVLGYGNQALSQFIPTGDFRKDEGPTLYANTFNILCGAFAYGVKAARSVTAIFLNCQKERQGLS